MMKANNAFNVILRVPVMLLALSCLYSLTESETSYTWKLDAGIGKIMPDEVLKAEDKNQELMLDILMSTVANPDGMWKKTASVAYCSNCPNKSVLGRNNRGLKEDHPEESSSSGVGQNDLLKDEDLDCGKPVNFTYYDHLVGIQNRASHPHIPEPEVASTFRGISAKSKNREADIDLIERRLKRSKREKPKSVDLYNQIGNFWRIKGDTHKSIECFRRALAVSPNNADILLNLARVLFNLQYLDDAIFLTRRSLEVQPPDQNAWMQHFQLGEILKAYCHYQEAALHLRHVLELKPNYGPALAALQDMESIPDSSVHGYTVLIIVILVCAVLAWVLITLDINFTDLWKSGTLGSHSTSSESNGYYTKGKSRLQYKR
jgi:tetratricopeptide (TPR) repeat protein